MIFLKFNNQKVIIAKLQNQLNYLFIMIDAILRIDHKFSANLIIPQKYKFLRVIAALFAHSGDSWFWMIGLGMVWLLGDSDWHLHSAYLAIAVVIQAVTVLSIK
jgi:hypothetical protein